MAAKILIIDDDADIRLGIENRITWMGHEPLTAANGKEGLRLIQQEEPDLVLLDIQLPGISGLDLLKQLHQSAEHARDSTTAATVPLTPSIIMLTAFGTIERAVQAMQLGAV